MHNPHINSQSAFSPVWSGFSDSSLRPAICVISTPSGYRPAVASDFAANISLGSGFNVTITGIVDNEQVTQIAGSGVLADANKLIIDSLGRISVTQSPLIPASQDIYVVTLTGVGVFNNYTATVPAVVGTVVMSMEPPSSNTDPIYYAFSSSATTGTAWELRGDRTIEVSGTQTIFFATAVTGQKVIVHYQKF